MNYNLYLPLLVSFYMAFNPNKLVSMNYNLYLPLLVSFYMAFNPNKLVSMNEQYLNAAKDFSLSRFDRCLCLCVLVIFFTIAAQCFFTALARSNEEQGE